MGKTPLIILAFLIFLLLGCLINDPAFETYDKETILKSERSVIVTTPIPKRTKK